MTIIRYFAVFVALVLKISASGLSPHVEIGEKFNLYVWGNGIPGLRIFYADGEPLIPYTRLEDIG
jgi:hypothetical protein